MVRPWGRRSRVPVGGQTARQGRCMVKSLGRDPHTSFGMISQNDRYMDAHVIEGYKFLMNNYRVGDKICIFGMSPHIHFRRLLTSSMLLLGFSRGAYVARCGRNALK